MEQKLQYVADSAGAVLVLTQLSFQEAQVADVPREVATAVVSAYTCPALK
jgi:hypothetical protein